MIEEKNDNKKFLVEIYINQVIDRETTEYHYLKKEYEVCLGVDDLKKTLDKLYNRMKKLINEKIEKIKV